MVVWEHIIPFINNGIVKSIDNYYMKGKQQEKVGTQRMYIVGKYEIDKENKNGKVL